MNLISGPSQYKIATSQVDIAQAQRLALSMSILTQVHVAYNDFFNRKRQYELSEQLQDVDARIHEQTMNQAKSGAQNHMNEIRSSTASLMAEYRSYQNYASLQSACGQIIATLGDDPLPNTVSSHEIKPLSGEIGAWLYGPGAICVPAATPPATVAKPAPEPVVKPALAVIAQAVPATAPAAVLLPPEHHAQNWAERLRGNRPHKFRGLERGARTPSNDAHAPAEWSLPALLGCATGTHANAVEGSGRRWKRS